MHWFFKGVGFFQWIDSCRVPISDEWDCLTFEHNARHTTQNQIKYGRMDHISVFHFEGGNAPCVILRFQKWNKQPFPECVLHTAVHVCTPNKYESLYIKSGQVEGHGADGDLVKLAFSCMAYIQAFPEMVRPGIPDDIANQNHFRKMNAVTIGIAPRLIERDGPCPHYRLGHFRVLTNERFTKKRFQTVFVHGAFIKGKAATVNEIT
jgi:hypothetical protein